MPAPSLGVPEALTLRPVPPLPPAPRAAATREAQEDKAAARRARKKKAREAMAARAHDTTEPGFVPEDAAPMTAFWRPRPVILLAVMDAGIGVASLVVAWASLTGRLATSIGPSSEMDAVLLGAHGLLLSAAALWLFSLHPMGRYAQAATAGLGVFSGFVAAAASIPVIIYVLRPGVKLLFSGRDPVHLSAAERKRVREDTASPLLVPAAVALQALLSAAALLPVLGAIRFR
jgi:hypothetical protein